jgi:hypothetical protein
MPGSGGGEKGRGSGGGERELAGSKKGEKSESGSSSIDSARRRASSRLSCSLSQAALSGELTSERASWMGESMERRQAGQGNLLSRAFVAAVVTKHCVQNWCPHGVVVKPEGPKGSWQMGQGAGPSGGRGGGGEAMPLGAGGLMLGSRAAGALEPGGITAGPPGAESADSCTPGARGGGAPPSSPPASTPNPWPRDPLGTKLGEEGEPPGVGAE